MTTSETSKCGDYDKRYLSEEEISHFVRDGVLVVDNILSSKQIDEARSGLSRTLSLHGIDTKNLALTGHALRSLSSTNGSGGVLDIFYPGWKMEIASNPRLFHVTCQLWQVYCHDGETRDDLDDDNLFKWHPHGEFDCQRGFMYIDRIGYRLPTDMAEKIGSDLQQQTGNTTKASKKAKPIQRCLTPHLDCCPETFYSDKSKWRPIQCFVSLTDNDEKNTGGFEAAPGFHRSFHKWAKSRPPTTIAKKVNGINVETSFPAPCIGEYTHIRPKEDQDIMDRIRHIAVRAGSAVFWDNRIPHANAYRNNGMEPRAVVYCSFLPDVKLNRQYISNQLLNWKRQRPPTDQWINVEISEDDDTTGPNEDSSVQISELGRKLLGIDPW